MGMDLPTPQLTDSGLPLHDVTAMAGALGAYSAMGAGGAFADPDAVLVPAWPRWLESHLWNK